MKLTTDQKARVLRRDSSCVYCGSQENLTVDHVIPMSRRRDYKLTPREINNYGNLVTACEDCNRQKTGKLPHEFFAESPDKLKHFMYAAKYVSDRVKQDITALSRRFVVTH